MTDALTAALEQGGWRYSQNASVSESEIRAYFSEANFRYMFDSEWNASYDCGGYSLDDCAEAVIAWHAEAYT